MRLPRSVTSVLAVIVLIAWTAGTSQALPPGGGPGVAGLPPGMLTGPAVDVRPPNHPGSPSEPAPPPPGG